MAGLQYLRRLEGISDEEVVGKWLEHPCWQYFCGEEYCQTQLPIDPGSMTCHRRRIGESGCEYLLKETVDAGLRARAVKGSDFRQITVDSTVQDKAVSFPTDGKLPNRCQERLVRLSRRLGVGLRQSHARLGPRRLRQAGACGHAGQYRRMRREVKGLRTCLGWVVRDIERRISGEPVPEAAFQEELSLAKCLLAQLVQDRHKLYSVHAPEVECIAKGKARQRHESGVKVSIAVANRSNFAVGGQSLPGNPCDGHALAGALEQVGRLTAVRIREVFVDRGCLGHGVAGTGGLHFGPASGDDASSEALSEASSGDRAGDWSLETG